MRAFLVVSVVVVLVLAGLWIFRRFRTSTAELGGGGGVATPEPGEFRQSGDQITSLVLLLKEPRAISERELQVAAERAFGCPFGHNGDYIAAAMPRQGLFIVRTPEMGMGVITVNAPYFADVAAAAESVQEHVVVEAIQGHSAWLAVDLVGEPHADGVAVMYGMMAMLIGQFVGPEALAVMRTSDGKIVAYVPAFADLLRRGEVDAIFES